MSEQKIESKYIDKDPPMGTEQQLEKKNNDYLAYLKEKLNFILGTYGRRLTSANGEINELTRTAEETTSRLSDAEGDISAISQRADNIEISVAGKVGENEVIAKINASPEQIKIAANRITVTGFVTFSDLSTAGNTTINGANVTTGLIKDAQNKNSWNLNTGAFTITNGSIDITTATESDDKIILQSITNGITYSLRLTPGSINLKASGGSMKNRTLQFSRSSFAMRFFDDDGGMAGIGANSIWVGGAGGGGFDGRVNLYKSDGNVGNQMVAAGDSVIEKGTSGGWAYRKWYSGVYECWTTIAPVEKSFSAWGTGYYSTEMGGLAYPVTFKTRPTEIPSVIAGNAWYSLMSSDTANTTTTSGKYRALRPVSGNAYVGLALYVKGELP
jgi:hypothetical protein